MKGALVGVLCLLKPNKLLTFFQKALFCLFGLKALMGVTEANNTLGINTDGVRAVEVQSAVPQKTKLI